MNKNIIKKSYKKNTRFKCINQINNMIMVNKRIGMNQINKI